MRGCWWWVAVVLFSFPLAHAQQQTLDTQFHHLRKGDVREWSEFPEQADKKELVVKFSSLASNTRQTLSLRQYDVKQNWSVVLNNHRLGSLVSDEKDMIVYYEVPPGILHNGENVLLIKSNTETSDDIRVGQIILDKRPVAEVLSDAAVKIEIVDGTTGNHIPSRITIVNAAGVLQTVLADTSSAVAARPGYVYTGKGRMTLRFPEGTYRLYASRGFEYGIDSIQLSLSPGDTQQIKFILNREVNTEGWVSCDTHIHTFTHSGHGDATERERVISIAGEGLELPILTDHNKHVDLMSVAVECEVNSWFTLVTGNEVTTKVGHFNIFPVSRDSPVADHQADSWKTLSQNINQNPGIKAIILNHGRDVHNNFRPFDPSRFLASAGARLDGEEVFANAMEVINSGSQQTDIMQLFRDWFGMLNRGHFLTPVGSSDSHDVSRYFVGQGRTYIRCDDQEPSDINIDQAVENFLKGNVMVSLGLLTKITVNDKYGPGDLVPATDVATVKVEVHGPAWIKAEKIALYANGKKIREAIVENGATAGMKWSCVWELPIPTHDIFLVAIAEGPAGNIPWWPIAKPYQPSSPEWFPHVMGATGAVWIDADKNGERNSAFDYAKVLLNKSGMNVKKLVKLLTRYDEAVAIQAAALLQESGKNLKEHHITKALKKSSPATRAGFEVIMKE